MRLFGCYCVCMSSSCRCLQWGVRMAVWRVSHFCNNYATVLSQHLCYFASSKGRQTIPPLVDWFYENWKSKANPEAVWLFPTYSYCCCTHFIVRVLFYEMKPFPLFLLQREAKRLFLFLYGCKITKIIHASQVCGALFVRKIEGAKLHKISKNAPVVYILWIKFVFLRKKMCCGVWKIQDNIRNFTHEEIPA